MTDYPMLFESIVLTAWGKMWRREDPFKLGDADTLKAVDNELTGINGREAKFALSSALKKVAAETEGTAVHGMLIDLDNKLWEAETYNDVCQILDKTKVILESIGKVIV